MWYNCCLPQAPDSRKILEIVVFKPLRPILLITLLAVLFAGTQSQATPVTFQVHMGRQMALGAFDPQQDSVDVAGSFNGWGTAPLTVLSDADGDSTYTVTVDGFSSGETFEFKFRINGLWDGSEEFPGVGNNRVYTVTAGENVVDVWYNDFAPGSGQVDPSQLSWWNDAVFYEIFVRSFKDSDGDGIGDLPGLTARLDYLNDGDPATDTDLGITGIWLMPINDSPSYHGYDSTDYRAINPDYGTLEDFQTFLAAAHARGIKVIVDLVMNHCSNQHPWFVQAAAGNPDYRDYFRWSASDPGEIGPWGDDHRVWHWNSGGWYYGIFWSGMPDLNYDTPALKTEMFDTATWWLDTVGVDGFRLDAVLYIDEDPGQLQNTPGTLQFWHDYNAHVKSVKADMLSVGEAWDSTGTVLQYVSDDRLDLCFEFELAGAMLGAAGGGSAGGLATKAAQVYGLYPSLQYATFLTNHDQNRLFTVLGEDENKNKVAAGLLLTQPGVPFLYYGEEIGMAGAKPDEFIRTPMQWDDSAGAGFTSGTPWISFNGNFDQYNVAAETDHPASLLSWYRRLVHLRNDTPALRLGRYQALGSDRDAVLVFGRQHEGQTLLCLANTGDAAQDQMTASGLVGLLEPGPVEVVDLLNPADRRTVVVGEDFAIQGLELDPYQLRVYEVQHVSAAPEEEAPPLQHGLRLEPNHPNPFNPVTEIRYSLAQAAPVRLGVYDVAGRLVRLLVSERREAGAGTARWDGCDERGRGVSSGVYFARLDAGGLSRVIKMVLAR